MTCSQSCQLSNQALNDKLGYRRLPGWLAWEKTM